MAFPFRMHRIGIEELVGIGLASHLMPTRRLKAAELPMISSDVGVSSGASMDNSILISPGPGQAHKLASRICPNQPGTQ